MHYERSDPSEQEGKKTLHISKLNTLTNKFFCGCNNENSQMHAAIILSPFSKYRKEDKSTDVSEVLSVLFGDNVSVPL